MLGLFNAYFRYYLFEACILKSITFDIDINVRHPQFFNHYGCIEGYIWKILASAPTDDMQFGSGDILRIFMYITLDTVKQSKGKISDIIHWNT